MASCSASLVRLRSNSSPSKYFADIPIDLRFRVPDSEKKKKQNRNKYEEPKIYRIWRERKNINYQKCRLSNNLSIRRQSIQDLERCRWLICHGNGGRARKTSDGRPIGRRRRDRCCTSCKADSPKKLIHRSRRSTT